MENDEVKNAVTDMVKKKRTRPDLSVLQSPTTEPGDMSRMLKQAVTMSHWPPVQNTDDPDQVAERIDMYHQFCFENDIKPDMSGMALAFGVSRKTLWAWENGVDSNKPQSVRNALKKGRQINEYLMTQLMQDGKLNPVTAIFLLKNNHDYRDQQEVVVTPQTPVSNIDPDEARKRILDAIPVEPID